MIIFLLVKNYCCWFLLVNSFYWRFLLFDSNSCHFLLFNSCCCHFLFSYYQQLLPTDSFYVLVNCYYWLLELVNSYCCLFQFINSCALHLPIGQQLLLPLPTDKQLWYLLQQPGLRSRSRQGAALLPGAGAGAATRRVSSDSGSALALGSCSKIWKLLWKHKVYEAGC